MEENLPKDDNLENFVRKSFDQYEENPSSDFWSRIEGDLAKEVTQPPSRIHPLYFSWKAAAVAAVFILSVGLIAQHLYFTHKIKQLATQTPDTTAIIPSEEQTSPPSATTTPIQDYKQTDYEPVTALEEHAAQLAATPGGVTPSQGWPAKEEDASMVITNGQKLSTGNQSNQQLVASDNSAVENKTTLADEGSPEKIAGSQIEVSSESNLRAITPVFPRFSEEVALNDDGLQLDATPAIKPLRSRGWYLGAQSTVVQTRERAVKKEEPFDNKHVVANKRKEPLQTTQWWLKAGKTNSSSLGFETGIGYQHFQRDASHQPDFKLRDGRPSMGGGGPHHHDDHEFDFQYTLNSFSGTQNIELRVAQADSNAMYPDNEPLDLSVNTHEQVEILKVPVLAVAAFGKGRTKAVVKGGLVGNFILKNDFEITGVSNINPHFFQPDDDRPDVQTQSPQKFSVDYLLAAGVEYRVTPAVSLVAEPTLSGELSFNDAGLCARPKLWSVGLNMGLNYRF